MKHGGCKVYEDQKLLVSHTIERSYLECHVLKQYLR